MKRTCYVCKEKYPKRTEDLYFFYDGLSFAIPSEEVGCAKCTMNEYISDFENYGRGVVSIKKDDLVVNWKNFIDRKGNKNKTERINRLLISLGLFSLTPEGNWMVLSEQTPLNPQQGRSRVFFTRKEDAVSYAELNYSHSPWRWYVCHIGEVIFQKPLLAKT